MLVWITVLALLYVTTSMIRASPFLFSPRFAEENIIFGQARECFFLNSESTCDQSFFLFSALFPFSFILSDYVSGFIIPILFFWDILTDHIRLVMPSRLNTRESGLRNLLRLWKRYVGKTLWTCLWIYFFKNGFDMKRYIRGNPLISSCPSFGRF